MDHVTLVSQLNVVAGDGETMRSHQKKLRDDYRAGRYGNNERVKQSFAELDAEEAYKPPRVVANVMFLAMKLTVGSPIELKALCDLYGFVLSPLEVTMIFKVREVINDVVTSNVSKNSG